VRLLIFWDIYWRVWRRAFKNNIKSLKKIYNPDFLIANWENLTSGYWPILKHILEMKESWVDLLTWWNHIFDNEKTIKDYLNDENGILIRPANFYESEYYTPPGKGYKILEKNWKKLLVINLLSGVFFRDEVFNPFLKIDEILKSFDLNEFNWVIVDFHRETSSEIYAMSMFLDWKISFLYWTHTHIQTNDELILPAWTGLISDVWMTWPLYSVIWADYNSVINRFLSWILKWKIEQSLNKEYVLNAVFVDIDDKTRKCLDIEKIKIKG